MNLDEILAYCCIGIAVVIFGTNFIPVKKIATGDGLFFQASVCHGNIFQRDACSWKEREVGKF